MRKAVFFLIMLAPTLDLTLSVRVASAAENPRQEFRSACQQAFQNSKAEAPPEVSQEICQCTAEESKHQGVTTAALKYETAQIKKDPKYEIKDYRLLSAFRWCTIEMMKRDL